MMAVLRQQMVEFPRQGRRLMSAKSIFAAVILALLLLAQPATVAAPATQPTTRRAGPTTQRVNRLVDALASDDWKERQKAMDDLGMLGQLVEAQLREKLKQNPDPTTIPSIEALLHQIAKGGKIAPTLITLK